MFPLGKYYYIYYNKPYCNVHIYDTPLRQNFLDMKCFTDYNELETYILDYAYEKLTTLSTLAIFVNVKKMSKTWFRLEYDSISVMDSEKSVQIKDGKFIKLYDDVTIDSIPEDRRYYCNEQHHYVDKNFSECFEHALEYNLKMYGCFYKIGNADHVAICNDTSHILEKSASKK
jgi:hypothetical protein